MAPNAAGAPASIAVSKTAAVLHAHIDIPGRLPLDIWRRHYMRHTAAHAPIVRLIFGLPWAPMRRALLIAALLVGVCGCGAASAASSSHSGIAGRTLATPTCPVETVPPDPSCSPHPISVAIRISAVGGRTPSEVVHSGSDGRFRLRLPAGVYELRPLRRAGSPFPRPPAPFRVRVDQDRFSHRTIYYDTGIR